MVAITKHQVYYVNNHYENPQLPHRYTQHNYTQKVDKPLWLQLPCTGKQVPQQTTKEEGMAMMQWDQQVFNWSECHTDSNMYTYYIKDPNFSQIRCSQISYISGSAAQEEEDSTCYDNMYQSSSLFCSTFYRLHPVRVAFVVSFWQP